jgi:hypothetical protein
VRTPTGFVFQPAINLRPGLKASKLIRAGYDDWLSITTNTTRFEVKFLRKAVRFDSDFLKAADLACQLFVKRYHQRPLYLALSGGIDSEFVAETMWRNQIPFTPIIMKIQDFNEVESWYAEYWCQKKKIQPLKVQVTIDQYVRALIKYSKSLIKLGNLCQVPILYLYEYVSNLNGVCIYSAGDINLDHKSGKFYCNSLDFISDILGLEHPTAFFMYTPELALSYISNFDPVLSEQENKLNFYKVNPRPKIDYLQQLYDHPAVKRVTNNIFHTVPYTFQTETFWYGNQIEIMSQLYDKSI